MYIRIKYYENATGYYVIEAKKHWWNKWGYLNTRASQRIMCIETREIRPQLYESVKSAIEDIERTYELEKIEITLK